MSKDRVVLAYSGGLGASVAIGWIGETDRPRSRGRRHRLVGQGGRTSGRSASALDCGPIGLTSPTPRRFASRLHAGPEAQRALRQKYPLVSRAVAPSSPSTWSRPPEFGATVISWLPAEATSGRFECLMAAPTGYISQCAIC